MDDPYNSIRVLFYDEQNIFIKLSSLIKYDADNLILKEEFGICKPKTKINKRTTIDIRKTSNNKLNNPFTKRFVNIEAHFKNIIQYLDTKKIIDIYFIPQFKKDDYFEGTRQGILALIDKLK